MIYFFQILKSDNNSKNLPVSLLVGQLDSYPRVVRLAGRLFEGGVNRAD